jgi:hypothetical protein
MTEIKTIDLAFDNLQKAYDAATEAEEWFINLWVSEKDGVFKLTDYEPSADSKLHLRMINDQISLLTDDARKLK